MAEGHGLPAAQRSTGEKWDWPAHWGHETVAIMSESRFREVHHEAWERRRRRRSLRYKALEFIVNAASALIIPEELRRSQQIIREAKEELCQQKWARELARRVRAQQREQQREQEREERAGAAAAAASVDFS